MTIVNPTATGQHIPVHFLTYWRFTMYTIYMSHTGDEFTAKSVKEAYSKIAEYWSWSNEQSLSEVRRWLRVMGETSVSMEGETGLGAPRAYITKK